MIYSYKVFYIDALSDCRQSCGTGILPVIHGQDAHATLPPASLSQFPVERVRSRNDEKRGPLDLCRWRQHDDFGGRAAGKLA